VPSESKISVAKAIFVADESDMLWSPDNLAANAGVVPPI